MLSHVCRHTNTLEPLISNTKARLLAVESAPSLPSRATKGRILVVDDDDLVTSTIELMLRTAGYDVTACLNAMDALEKVRFCEFDLIITDLRMPVMTGLDLIQLVRAGGFTVPIFILTGFVDQLAGNEKSQLDGLSVQEILLKPTPMKELLSRIAMHVPPVHSARPT